MVRMEDGGVLSLILTAGSVGTAQAMRFHPSPWATAFSLMWEDGGP